MADRQLVIDTYREADRHRMADRQLVIDTYREAYRHRMADKVAEEIMK
jgi:hypothetical protein